MLTVADATMDTAFASCSIVATSDSRRCGLGSTLFVCRDRQSHPHVKLDDSYWLLRGIQKQVDYQACLLETISLRFLLVKLASILPDESQSQ